MREQFFQRDMLPRRIDLLNPSISKDLDRRAVPPQLPFFDQKRDQGRGHAFGVGADMKQVVGRDPLFVSSATDSGCS